MPEKGDLAPQVFSFLRRTLSIDRQWTHREERGFTWWPGTYGQRIWADPVRQSFGERVTAVHVRTEVVRNVQDSDRVREVLSGANMFARMAGLVHEPDTGQVALHSSAYFTTQNLSWLRSLIAMAALLQAAETPRYGEMVELLGGEFAESGHPDRGIRTDQDEVLGAVEGVRARGGEPSPFAIDSLEDTLATAEEWGLEARLEDSRLILDTDVGAGIVISVTETHPELGSGALFLLHLGGEPASDAAGRAAELNRREMSGESMAHTFGGWCASEGTVSFAGFLPAVLGDQLPHGALFLNLAFAMTIRAKWAQSHGH